MNILDIHEGYDIYTMERFEFEYGRVLESVSVEYSLIGTPKFDDEGNIVNAVIYCHPYNRNYSSITNLYEITRSGASFDKDEYFIISITSLGVPDSCSPSTTNLKYYFPKYSIKDCVNFKRQFLAEKFGIKKLHGILAWGLGGYEAYTWACEYPDEMDFLVVHSSAYKTTGYKYVVSKCMDSIIDSYDDFDNENYGESLSHVMIMINRLLYSTFLSKKMFQDMSNDEIDVLMDDFVDEGLFFDFYDFKFINDAIIDYNLEKDLKKIKAKTLILSTNSDIYFSPEFDTLPLKDMIKDSKVILYDFNRENEGEENYSHVEEDLREFLSQFKK